MNQKVNIQTACALLFLSCPFTYCMDLIQQKLDAYEGLYRVIQTSNAISANLIREIIRETQELDAQIEQLSDAQKRIVIPQAKSIQLRYRGAFRRALRRQAGSAYALNQDRIYKIIGATAVSATWTATSSLIYLWLQQQTGNIDHIDQSTLLTAALEGVVVELVRQGFDEYNANARIGNIAAFMSKDPIISSMSAASAMVVHRKTFIKAPTMTGTLWAGLKTELFVVMNDVIEKEGGITGILNKVKTPKFLFGTRQLSQNEQQLVQVIRPSARSMIINPRIQQTLKQILLVTTDAVLIGILAHLMGVGFPNESTLIATIEGAAYRGLLEGCFAYIMDISGGLLPTVASGTLSRAVQNDVIRGAGLSVTRTDVATVLIEKSVQTGMQYTIDEFGGPSNFVKSLISKMVRAVNQKWWIPFKEFSYKVGDSILEYVGFPAES